jgi:hypothetical protein
MRTYLKDNYLIMQLSATAEERIIIQEGKNCQVAKYLSSSDFW